MDELIVIGGGLAGSEAAWQAATRGVKVILYEMRPLKFTEAHKTEFLGSWSVPIPFVPMILPARLGASSRSLPWPDPSS